MSWKRVGELTGDDQKEKRMKRNEDNLKDLGAIPRALIFTL